MTIKKLTVAAAIAVGIVTGSLNQAMATCPCTNAQTIAPCAEALPVVTGGACPCDTTPQTTCNKCKKSFDECDCDRTPDPCNDPCNLPKDDCGCKDADLSCEPDPEPACAACAQTGKPSRKDMKQVYGYPNAIYGTNNYVGEPANSILSTENTLNGCSAPRMSSGINGVTVTTDGQVTGAASHIPCLNEAPDRYNGIQIMRNERTMDGNNCPIEIQTSNSIDAVKKTIVPFDMNAALSDMGINNTTGAAANLGYTGGCAFPDVPNGYWAACDIDKLAMNDVVVGYPDGYFKPNKNIIFLFYVCHLHKVTS